MKNVYDLLETISNRTAMYTGEYTLSNIRSFVDGYIFCIKGKGDLEEFLSSFPGFHNWVASKLGFYESTAGWHNMILAVEMGYTPKEIKWAGYADNATIDQHKASVTRFFELVREYQNA